MLRSYALCPEIKNLTSGKLLQSKYKKIGMALLGYLNFYLQVSTPIRTIVTKKNLRVLLS